MARKKRVTSPPPRLEEIRWWIEHHQRAVQGVSIAFVVVILCVVGILTYQGYRQHQGIRALQKGLEALYEQRKDASIKYLGYAADVLPKNTVENRLALLHLGRAYAQDQQVAFALSVWQRLVAAPVREQSAYLQQVAFIELARVAEERGDMGSARQWYSRAIDIEGPLRAEALMLLGSVLEVLGEEKGAKAQYQRILAEYDDFPLAEVVQEKVEK